METLTYQSLGLRAAEAFIAAGFKDGDTVTREWLCEQFELENNKVPGYGPCCRVFRDILLKRYRVDLETLYGRGYRVIPPRECTRRAVETGTRRIRSAISHVGVRLACVDVDRLTDAEQKENSDTIGRLAQLAVLMSRNKLLP